MKDLLRLKTSLTEEVEGLLNEQIKMEAKSSATYLSMASWCDRHGFDNSADFLYRQAEEEREHMMKIFKYVNDLGGAALSPEISDISTEFDSFRGIFEEALQQEIAVTQSFNRIAAKCQKLHDFTTFNFLAWFLNEQIEEEYIARRCLELFEVIGEEGAGQYMIDKQIAKVTYKA
ncbi:ferritin [Catalinimonas alkaloidigena]|uniref:ferritin n=1 Tax=Catalinimonas alkaloidigena TaxID=1075417 RepID=UPI002405965D|nr:ferritin [Catalinimonas alkaloidigena]MDF9798482.1 ferritin [Catalinimonas alkaloidigena]